VPEVKRIHHVALLVEDLQPALVLWQDLFGIKKVHVEEKEDEGARVAFLQIGDSRIELVEPKETENGLTRYLKSHGAGVHHICLEVDNISGMLERLKTEGVRLINEEPRTEPDGKKYAFVHPESTFGVLIELYELPKKE
jgi:methylmalonyl-CoA/ethylmalonyl-CoA epimerase